MQAIRRVAARVMPPADRTGAEEATEAKPKEASTTTVVQPGSPSNSSGSADVTSPAGASPEDNEKSASEEREPHKGTTNKEVKKTSQKEINEEEEKKEKPKETKALPKESRGRAHKSPAKEPRRREDRSPARESRRSDHKSRDLSKGRSGRMRHRRERHRRDSPKRSTQATSSRSHYNRSVDPAKTFRVPAHEEKEGQIQCPTCHKWVSSSGYHMHRESNQNCITLQKKSKQRGSPSPDPPLREYFDCSLCKRWFDSRYSLQQHMMSKHPDRLQDPERSRSPSTLGPSASAVAAAVSHGGQLGHSYLQAQREAQAERQRFRQWWDHDTDSGS
eukprot:Skav222620  [mRNA]  locus=scaffold4205:60420:62135:- [translate_table: standard]